MNDKPVQHWAHSPAAPGMPPHLLPDHLRGVADRAALFAQDFGAAWAELAGRWHDLGKYRIGFQTYIRQDPDAHIKGERLARGDKTHSAAGALHAIKVFEARWGPDAGRAARVLAYVIAGHHTGLNDWIGQLDNRLLGTGQPDAHLEYQQAHTACSQVDAELLELPAAFDLRQTMAAIPGLREREPLALAHWTRMLFSALVDADFLDTESYRNTDKHQAREGFAPLADYLAKLDAHLAEKAQAVAAQGRADDAVMQARASVLARCRELAAAPPGVYTLEVPTGGGKTLSSLAFALQHALAHGQRRVIYAIPYTSIIEQTATVFADIFGRDALVEHHSQIDVAERGETTRSRLACENWDAPLVVTTNVQLFESLFAARTSRCRKLHRLARSVIVLDEAQMLPPEFLQPMLDVLRLLVNHYGVTLLLCTATQPVLTDMERFDARQSVRGLPQPTPIVADGMALYRALERVRFEWPPDLHTPLSTPELAGQVAQHDAVLVIVNTRRAAAELVAALDRETGGGTLHLSASMCGQHRADVIRDIRERLQARREGRDKRPLRVVATQVVEAGVDIDFPVVFRALAGLDSLAQAAGRCNREGLLAQPGRVIIFVQPVPQVLSSIVRGVAATLSVLGDERPCALTPEHFTRYFQNYHSAFKPDAHGIVPMLNQSQAPLSFAFRTAADAFKLVDDTDSSTLIVPYASTDPGARPIDPLVAALEQGQTDRWLMRALQRYTISARNRELQRWQQQGDVREMQPGLYLLTTELRYDTRLGLLMDHAAPAPALLVL